MQNETQNQDTNTQVITQEESPAQNEPPQNQDIDPAVTMSSDDLVGSDPSVTMHPEDLFDPEMSEEPDPSVTMRPEDLLDPEMSEEPIIEDWDLGQPVEGAPEYIINPDGSVTEIIESDPSDPVIEDWDLGRPSEEYYDVIHTDPSDPVIEDWDLGQPVEGAPEYVINPDGSVTEIIEVDPSEEEGPQNYVDPIVGDQQYVINPDGSVTEIIEVDPSEPVIADWGFGGPPSGPQTIDLAAPSAEEAGRNADGDPDLHGCAFGEYDEDLDVCLPSPDDYDFFPVLYGDKPLPDSAGGYLALPGEAAGDVALGLGTGISAGGAYVEKALDWYGEGGGPIGLGFQGLGATIGFATEVSGTIVSGAGELVGGVSDAVGDAVDAVDDTLGAIGDAAEDAWDTVSGWF